MPKLLLASRNLGKLKELRALLQALPAELLTPYDLNLDLRVAETGSTFAENAARKAQAYASHTGLLTLADDSGLEVAALGGAPGLYSARYVSEPGATDADRRAYLLAQLRGYPRPWEAQFRCVVAVAAPEEPPWFVEGVCPGEIIPEERGDQGFGYDPIFLLPEAGRTMAELEMEQKNRLSHRARAIQAALPELKKLITKMQASD